MNLSKKEAPSVRRTDASATREKEAHDAPHEEWSHSHLPLACQTSLALARHVPANTTYDLRYK